MNHFSNLLVINEIGAIIGSTGSEHGVLGEGAVQRIRFGQRSLQAWRGKADIFRAVGCWGWESLGGLQDCGRLPRLGAVLFLKGTEGGGGSTHVGSVARSVNVSVSSVCVCVHAFMYRCGLLCPGMPGGCGHAYECGFEV